MSPCHADASCDRQEREGNAWDEESFHDGGWGLGLDSPFKQLSRDPIEASIGSPAYFVLSIVRIVKKTVSDPAPASLT